MFHGSLSPIVPQNAGAEVDVESFRAAMRELAGGVAVVTVGKDEAVTGFTATSISSLSVQPPRLIVCVDRSSASWLALQRYPYFGVNFLRSQERMLANRFAGRNGLEGAARYAGSRWTTMTTGAAILKDGLASLDCEVEELLMRYDHSIVIGRVRAVQVCPGAFPLVYWQSDYHTFEPTAERAGDR
jgi:flavin reductase (DIM6/NTAB) family NADH-FMN oxidoreductase RutF